MSTKYKATVPGKTYFVTIVAINWVDLFTRREQRMVLVDALNFCVEKKGLEINSYCIMPSHVHMICRVSDDSVPLANVMRDFKKFTSKKIIETVITETESRRDWLLPMFQQSCAHLKRKQTYKVWQTGYHAKVIETTYFGRQKLNYIHRNPVKDRIVDEPWEYVFSSARDYVGKPGLVKVTCLDW